MNDDLRIGDAERAAAAADLGEHFAQGRLTADEHEERLTRIWSARTHRDLTPAFADLPSPYAAPRPAFQAAPPRATWAPYAPPARPPADSLRDRAHDLRRRLPTPVVVVLAALLAITVVVHLPVILIGLLMFWLVAHGRHDRRWRRHPGHGWRS